MDDPTAIDPGLCGQLRRDPPRDEQAGVWFFSGDLIFAGRVRAAAESAGFGFALLGQWPKPDQDRPLDGAVPAFVVVDLSTRSAASAEVCRLSKEQFPRAKTIAYGPHVQAGRLAQARRDGFDNVLTRGQFDSMLPTLFH